MGTFVTPTGYDSSAGIDLSQLVLFMDMMTNGTCEAHIEGFRFIKKADKAIISLRIPHGDDPETSESITITLPNSGPQKKLLKELLKAASWRATWFKLPRLPEKLPLKICMFTLPDEFLLKSVYIHFCRSLKNGGRYE